MEKQKQIIKVIDFSSSPGPRYANQGDDSGEAYYHSVLNEAFAKAYAVNNILVVDLDGPDGYASSFLDEAFGNLIYDFGLDVVKEYTDIKSDEEPEWIKMLIEDTYPKWQARRESKQDPKVTENHPKWKRLINGEIGENIWIALSSGK